MASCYVKLTTDRGETAGYLTRGKGNETKLCGSFYRAYHFATRAEAEQAAHHFCQEVKGVAVGQGKNREYDLGFEVIDDVVPQLV